MATFVVSSPSVRRNAATMATLLMILVLSASRAEPVNTSFKWPELEALDQQFTILKEERVMSVFDADVAKLQASYLGGIAKKIAEEKAAGHLDGLLALEAEQKLVQGMGVSNSQPSDGTSKVPLPEDEADTPESLKALRRIYRAAYAQLVEAKAKNLQAIIEPLKVRLAALESTFTRADRIADAKVVREYALALADTAPAPKTDADVAPSNVSGTMTRDGYTNSLGMKFIPVKGTDVMFCIHETRYRDYAAFAADTPSVEKSWKDQSVDDFTPTERAADHPVIRVSWHDAKRFAEWLSKKEGRTYRLPTDREWSIAAGIGREENWHPGDAPADVFKSETEFPWGNKWPPPRGSGNYSDQSRQAKAPKPETMYLDDYTDGFPTTAPVMSYKPNRNGLYDIGGNVWEWCEDLYETGKQERAMRGGSWTNAGRKNLLTSDRLKGLPVHRYFTYGFRLVLDGKAAPR